MTKKEDYIKFCSEQAEMPIFSQAWYLDAICGKTDPTTSQEAWDVILVKKNNQIIASLPYYLKRKSFFSYITLPYLTKMMGPYIIPSFRSIKHQHKIFAELIAQIPAVDFFNQDFHYSIDNWLAFKWEGFKQTTNYSYVIENIDQLDQVFANFCADYRNNKIKKATTKLKVVSTKSLRDLHQVSKMSFDRQALDYLLSFDLLERLDAALEKNKARKMFFAVDEQDRIHSVLYLIWDNHSSYYLIAGDDPELRQSGASILLVWEAIQFSSKELGVKTFDFTGSMIPAIERVRRQFGAKQKAFYNLQKYYSTSFKVVEGIKGFLKKSYY